MITQLENNIWGWANLVLTKMRGWDSQRDCSRNFLNPSFVLSEELQAGDILHLRINGIQFNQSFLTDHDTTMAAAVSAINANGTITAAGVRAGIDSDDNCAIVFTISQLHNHISGYVEHGDEGTAEGALVPVIWKHQNGTIPNESYVTLHLSANTELGQKWKGLVDTSDPATPNGKQTIYWPEAHTLSVETYGAMADEYIQALKNSLDLSEVQTYFDQHAMSVVMAMSPKDLSVILDQQAESRMAMDLTVTVGVKMVDEDAGYIEHVEYDGTVGNHEI